MRIIQLTPGTGSFYCGTCLRDNALVTELRRRGHDAIMVPLYLPPTLDEAPASADSPLFYGGINVYLQQKSGVFRKTPRWVDRLLDAPGVLKKAAGRAGMTAASELADLTLSTLRGEEGNQLKELDRLAEWLAHEGRPDVVCLSNVLLIGLARRIKQLTGARVLCTLQGEDSFIDSFPEPDRQASWDLLAERAADVDLFVAVSRYYAEVMTRRARLPAERVHVVYNGISLEGFSPAPAPPDPPVLGYLSRMFHAKGLGTLVEAYLLLRASGRVPGLKLRVAGTKLSVDDAYLAMLRSRLAEKGVKEGMGGGTEGGMEGDVEFLPNISRKEKIEFLRGLSVLSVPTTYGESFGLYLVEAWAAGVPVVQPRHAAFPELLEATGGGLLCEPDDAQSLATCLEQVLTDREGASRMGLQARRVVEERFSVQSMAEGVERVLTGAATASPPFAEPAVAVRE